MSISSRVIVAAVAVAAALGVPPASAHAPQAGSREPVLVIGHRGASGPAPEHTFASYDLARSLGADYLEQDAQMTADGVLVSLHDPTLDRTARGPAEDCTGQVRTKTLAQLKHCDMGAWFNEAYPTLAKKEYVGQRIPTIEEVFRRYPRGINFHIETKDTAPDTDRELLRLLDAYALRTPAVEGWRVLVQSFSPSDLIGIHALDPALPTVQLLAAVPPPGPAREALLASISSYAVGIGPSSGGVDKALVDTAHAHCLQVQPYTVDAPAELRALVTAGVDGVFTNRPDVLNRVLANLHRARRGGSPLADAGTAAARSRTCRATSLAPTSPALPQSWRTA